MKYGDLLKLRRLERRARSIGRSLEQIDEPRISLPIGEALEHVSQVEAHLGDAVFTAEAELLKRPRQE